MSGLLAWAAAFWSSGHHPRRAYLFVKGVYLLLAFDLCFEMIEHGGRYGLGGFNVAHFELLDVLLPLPTPTLYVGLLIASAGLALQLALTGGARALRLLLCALYSLSWMLSMHDSYQHHYLLSWLLAWCAACPDLRAEQANESSLQTGWGLPMAAITCAIVYGFTAISKTDADWRGGGVLRVLTRSRPPGAAEPGTFDGARDLLLELGLSDAGVWQLFALSTIALQCAIAIGYLAAPTRDERPSWARSALTSIGLVAALSFHGAAELFGLFEIGLFSYYMIWIALVLLGPASLLAPLTRAIARGARLLAGLAPEDPSERTLLRRLAGPAAVTVLLVVLGFAVPLPGARWAFFLLSALTLLRFGMLQRVARAGAVERLALGTLLSGVSLWLALAKTSVPFDYYRRAAGELSRMGRLEQSLEMYRLAERYAPAGKSRMDRIRQLEAELGK